MSHLPDDWDPRPGTERWYRHATTGDRGFSVRRGGKEYIRLDRPNQEILRRVSDDFVEEDATRPLTPIHLARVCFEADKALCAGLGLMDKARGDWTKLTDKQRHAWMESGPKSPVARVVLYAGLKKLMGAFCGGG